MDWLTFTARVLEALAWPVAAVAIAAIFHRQLKGLLARVRRGSFGGAELEFEHEVRALAQELEDRSPAASALPTNLTDETRPPKDVPEHSPSAAVATPTEDIVATHPAPTSADSGPQSSLRSRSVINDVLSLSEADLDSLMGLMNPRAVILNSWRSVERALRDAGLASGDSNPLALSRSVRERLSSDQAAIFGGLRTLRNRVMHDLDGDPSVESALNYAAIAREFISQLHFSEQPT